MNIYCVGRPPHPARTAGGEPVSIREDRRRRYRRANGVDVRCEALGGPEDRSEQATPAGVAGVSKRRITDEIRLDGWDALKEGEEGKGTASPFRTSDVIPCQWARRT